MTARRARFLNRLLRQTCEVVAPTLMLVGLLALVAQLGKWSS